MAATGEVAMADQYGHPADGLADGERVVWSGRSRPAGALAAVVPNLLVAAVAACLALGFAPASDSMGLILSPVVESALRTVTPLPVPQIYVERARPRARPAPAPTPIAFVPAADQPPSVQPPATDVDLGVGAFLMVCKTLLLYLAAATGWAGLRSLSRQVRSRHAVTNLRVSARRSGNVESVSLRSVQGIRVRRHPFGHSLAIDVAGRRRPFVILGLSREDARDAERAIAAGL